MHSTQRRHKGPFIRDECVKQQESSEWVTMEFTGVYAY